MIQFFQTISFLLNLVHLSTAYHPLSDTSLQSLPAPGTSFDIHNGELLAPILQVRVPGTEGITKVRQHFTDFFAHQLPDWKITYQNSTQPTALGGKPIDFVNIIATRDPPWTSDRPGEVAHLVLAAHYDSKLTPTGFIGATDSAAPCAMLLHTALSLDAALTRKWEAMRLAGDTDGLEGERGLQIMLLDGEEAFVSWSDSDSLYGARALAEAWENEVHPAMSTFRNPLDGIELFVLLDLLGSANPRMPSYFKTTHWAYVHMAELEKRMRKQGILESPSNGQENPWFHEAAKNIYTGSFMGGMVQDDHLPFMARGVEILHLIPSPFPSVWHTPRDDGEHLDTDATSDWAVLTAAFAAEWMDLEGYIEAPRIKERETLDRRKDGGVEERTEFS